VPVCEQEDTPDKEKLARLQEAAHRAVMKRKA